MDLSIMILICLVLCFIFRNKILKVIILSLLGIFVILYIIILSTPVEVMRDISLFKVEDNELFSLDYSDNYVISLEQDTFYKSETFYFRGSNEKDIDTWLSDIGTKVCIKIYDKQDIIYTKSLPRDIKGSDIVSIIDEWKSTDKLPSSHIRYWFLCFYLEWKL